MRKLLSEKETSITMFEQTVVVFMLKICYDVFDGIRRMHAVEQWQAKYLRQSWSTFFNCKQMKPVFERATCPHFPLGQSLSTR